MWFSVSGFRGFAWAFLLEDSEEACKMGAVEAVSVFRPHGLRYNCLSVHPFGFYAKYATLYRSSGLPMRAAAIATA